MRKPTGLLSLETLIPRNSQGKLTNLSASISKARIVQWYQLRWQIESFFKLLKSAGHNLEQWQQESAAAIAKRLLVVAMACVVVWQLVRSNQPEAIEVRQLLVRLSGRQMKYNKPFTEPAILAGLLSHAGLKTPSFKLVALAI